MAKPCPENGSGRRREMRSGWRSHAKRGGQDLEKGPDGKACLENDLRGRGEMWSRWQGQPGRRQ